MASLQRDILAPWASTVCQFYFYTSSHIKSLILDSPISQSCSQPFVVTFLTKKDSRCATGRLGDTPFLLIFLLLLTSIVSASIRSVVFLSTHLYSKVIAYHITRFISAVIPVHRAPSSICRDLVKYSIRMKREESPAIDFLLWKTRIPVVFLFDGGHSGPRLSDLLCCNVYSMVHYNELWVLFLYYLYKLSFMPGRFVQVPLHQFHNGGECHTSVVCRPTPSVVSIEGHSRFSLPFGELNPAWIPARYIGSCSNVFLSISSFYPLCCAHSRLSIATPLFLSQ